MDGVGIYGDAAVVTETLPNVCAQQFCPVTFDESFWLGCTSISILCYIWFLTVYRPLTRGFQALRLLAAIQNVARLAWVYRPDDDTWRAVFTGVQVVAFWAAATQWAFNVLWAHYATCYLRKPPTWIIVHSVFSQLFILATFPAVIYLGGTLAAFCNTASIVFAAATSIITMMTSLPLIYAYVSVSRHITRLRRELRDAGEIINERDFAERHFKMRSSVIGIVVSKIGWFAFMFSQVAMSKETTQCDPVANMLLDLAVSLYTLTLVHSTNPGGQIGIPIWERLGWRAPRMPWYRHEAPEHDRLHEDIEAQDNDEPPSVELRVRPAAAPQQRLVNHAYGMPPPRAMPNRRDPRRRRASIPLVGRRRSLLGSSRVEFSRLNQRDDEDRSSVDDFVLVPPTGLLTYDDEEKEQHQHGASRLSVTRTLLRRRVSASTSTTVGADGDGGGGASGGGNSRRRSSLSTAVRNLQALMPNPGGTDDQRPPPPPRRRSLQDGERRGVPSFVPRCISVPVQGRESSAASRAAVLHHERTSQVANANSTRAHVISPIARVPIVNLSLLDSDDSFESPIASMRGMSPAQDLLRREAGQHSPLDPIDELRVSSASPGPEGPRHVAGITRAQAEVVAEPLRESPEFDALVDELHASNASPSPREGSQREQSNAEFDVGGVVSRAHVNPDTDGKYRERSDSDVSLMSELREVTASARFQELSTGIYTREFSHEIIDEVRELTSSHRAPRQEAAASSSDSLDELHASASSPGPEVATNVGHAGRRRTPLVVTGPRARARSGANARERTPLAVTGARGRTRSSTNARQRAAVADDLRRLTVSPVGVKRFEALPSAHYHDDSTSLDELRASAASPGPRGEGDTLRDKRGVVDHAHRDRNRGDMLPQETDVGTGSEFSSDVIDEIRELTTPVPRQALSGSSAYDGLHASAASPGISPLVHFRRNSESKVVPPQISNKGELRSLTSSAAQQDAASDNYEGLHASAASPGPEASSTPRDVQRCASPGAERRGQSVVAPSDIYEELRASATSPGPEANSTQAQMLKPLATRSRGRSVVEELRSVFTSQPPPSQRSAVDEDDDADFDDLHASAASPGPSTPDARYVTGGQQVPVARRLDIGQSVSPLDRQPPSDGATDSRRASVAEELRTLAASPPPTQHERDESSVFDDLHASSASPGPSPARTRVTSPTGTRGPVPAKPRVARNRSASIVEELRCLATSPPPQKQSESSIYDELHASAASPGPSSKNSGTELRSSGMRHQASSIVEELRRLATSPPPQDLSESSTYDELHASAASPGPHSGNNDNEASPPGMQKRTSSIDEELRVLSNSTPGHVIRPKAVRRTALHSPPSNTRSSKSVSAAEAPATAMTPDSATATTLTPAARAAHASVAAAAKTQCPADLINPTSTPAKLTNPTNTPAELTAPASSPAGSKLPAAVPPSRPSALRVPHSPYVEPKKRTSFSERVEVIDISSDDTTGQGDDDPKTEELRTRKDR